MKVQWRLDMREFQRLESKLGFRVRDRELGESFGEFAVLSPSLSIYTFFFFFFFF